MTGVSHPPSAVSGTARFADDTRRRFVREIVARVPIDRIVAVHLFAPIRQGGVETGVAVVAARRATEGDAGADAAEDVAVGEVPNDTALATDPVDAPDAIVADFAAGDDEAPDAVDAPEVAAIAEAEMEAAARDEAERATAATACDPTEDAARASDEAVPDDEPTVAELLAADLASDDVADAEPPAPWRHTVFTARYRLTIRGPDRGRWDADVVEEADAPLVTVDAVVRGVQRRAGDAAEPDRLDADAVTRLAEGRPLG